MWCIFFFRNDCLDDHKISVKRSMRYFELWIKSKEKNVKTDPVKYEGIRITRVEIQSCSTLERIEKRWETMWQTQWSSWCNQENASEDVSKLQPIRRNELRVLFNQPQHREGKPWNSQSGRYLSGDRWGSKDQEVCWETSFIGSSFQLALCLSSEFVSSVTLGNTL